MNTSDQPPEIIEISPYSSITDKAQDAATAIRHDGQVTLQAVGAAAISQAAQIATLTRITLLQDKIHILITPRYIEAMLGGTTCRVLMLHIVSQ